MKLKFFGLTAAILLSACTAKNATLVPPPVDYGFVESTAKGTVMKFQPKVDVLFIVDDSASMESHQKNLIRNINEFTKGISKSSVIDFHIGVTTVFDSTRYGPIVKQTCDGKVNWEPAGTLRPLTAPSGKQDLLKYQNSDFVSSRTGMVDVLKSTLDVGIKPLVDPKPGVCATGPEEEEIFSPLLESMSQDRVNGPNKGFWRKDSLKVFMILTDAKDATQWTADYVDATLRKALGADPVGPQNKYRVYAVTFYKGVRPTRSCRPDPAFLDHGKYKIDDHEIVKLAHLSGGKVYSICSSNYGKYLAQVGDDIRQTTLTEIHHELYSWPEQNTLRVCLDACKDDKSTDLPVGSWYWDSRRDKNEVVVHGNVVDWEAHPEAQLQITYTPIKNVFSSKTKVTGI